MSAKQYAAPWADQLPDGDLIEYGPSPSTYARQLARHKLWTWHPEKLASRVARTTTADAIRAYMRPTRHLRGDVPKRETEVYLLIYEHGRSIRWAARHLGISRSSVKVYVRRLARRAHTAFWMTDRGDGDGVPDVPDGEIAKLLVAAFERWRDGSTPTKTPKENP